MRPWTRREHSLRYWWSSPVPSFSNRPRGGAYTLEYEGEETLFAIEELRRVDPAVHPGTTSAWNILNDLGRRRLLLLGKESGAQRLMGDDATSRRFVLKGTLYVSNGTLALESVRKAEKETGK